MDEFELSRRDALRRGACGLGVVGAGCFESGGAPSQVSNESEPVQNETGGNRSETDPNGTEPAENETSTEQYDPTEDPEMELVFEDTFEAETIDAEKWRTNYPWGSREHNYDGYTSSQNVWVYDGQLNIRAEERAQNGHSYTTGVAAAKRSFTSGYVEGRIKTPPVRPGFWPAFWLTSATSWPPEIDLFEFFGDDPRAWMSYHYRDDHGDHQKVTSAFSGPDFSSSYHTYAVDWNADRIIWYIDDEERFRYAGDHVVADEMWLIFNFGINPEWMDEPPSEDLPATLQMSDVRVWERANPDVDRSESE